MNLNDSTKKEEIKRILKDGLTNEFWVLICQAINKDIEMLRNVPNGFADLPAEQYKFESELVREKINYLEALRAKPNEIINDLTEPDQSRPEHDPYS